MPDMWMDVDVALSEVPVNLLPLLDSTDFKTIEDAIPYNAPGMSLYWHFETSAGAYSVTAVTPTSGGEYDWTDQGASGIYTIEMPASGGASINNDTEGYGWFTGSATGVLPWRGPVIGFRAAAINDEQCDSASARAQRNLKEQYGISGTVWVVKASGGSDSNDGLSWATAYATIAQAISVAAAGDLILLSAGTHTVTTIILPCSMRGAGMDVTTVSSSTTGEVVKYESNTVVADLTISMTNAVATTGWQSGTKTGVNLHRVRIKGVIDCLILRGGEIYAEDCRFESVATSSQSGYTHVMVSYDSGKGTFRRCTFAAVSTGYNQDARCVEIYGGANHEFFNCEFRALNGNAVTSGVYTQSTTTATRGRFVDCRIITEASQGSTVDVDEQGNSILTLVNCSYNESNVTGTPVIVKTHRVTATDTSGGALGTLANQQTLLTNTGDIYYAHIHFDRDQANTKDEYTVQWFKNGAPVTSGITSPTIQVIKRADGTDLVASAAMTQIGSTGSYKYDESTARVTPGEAVVVVVGATIDAGSRTWRRPLGRDSA